MERKEELPSSGGEEPAPATPPQDGDLEAPLLPGEADGAPPPPRTAQQDTLLYVCAILSIVTAVGGLLCLVVNLISLLRSIDYRGFDYRVSVCPSYPFSTTASLYEFLYWVAEIVAVCISIEE